LVEYWKRNHQNYIITTFDPLPGDDPLPGEGRYLGTMSTVADAEELGVSMGWEKHDIVALDSTGVIQRILALQDRQPRSWIEEALVMQMAERKRTLMWVKGHSGIEGNEKADKKAKEGVEMGQRMLQPDIVTPAGIRQAFRPHDAAPDHLKWNSLALRGLTYMVTDKGPQAYWMKEIGKADRGSCKCDGWTQQNAAHLYRCPRVGDGKGRTREEIWKDEKWCEEVARFLR